MDNVGGDGNETGSVKKKKGKQKSTTGIDAILTPYFMGTGELQPSPQHRASTGEFNGTRGTRSAVFRASTIVDGMLLG